MTPEFLRAEAQQLRERAGATTELIVVRELLLLARELEKMAAKI